MKQMSFSDLEQTATRKTRRQVFLDEMNRLVPWSRLVEAVSPHYPVAKSTGGRPAIGLERMLRMYVAQNCLGLSDEGIEDAIYESVSVRLFVGIDLSRERAPDATTVLRFRRLLETQQLTEAIFAAIQTVMVERGLRLSKGTTVDATIIAAPTSTKNQQGERDPEMHQTKKGNQWHFGCKVHIGADTESNVVHAIKTTAANVSDITQVGDLLNQQEATIHGDAGYVGAAKREELAGVKAEWVIAQRRKPIKSLPEGPVKDKLLEIERVKASIRARVEHHFHVVKNLFRHRKARYRGLAKNAAQMLTLFALSNLVICKRKLLDYATIPS